MKFALSFYGELHDSVPFSTYTSNMVRTSNVVFKSWKYKNVLKTAHVTGTRLSELVQFVDVLHPIKSNEGDTSVQVKRKQLADAFTLLEFEHVATVFFANVEVYVDELSRPNPYSTQVLHDNFKNPWDGIMFGKVPSLKSCSMHTKVTGSPTYQLQHCCQFLKCQEFSRYNVRWQRPPFPDDYPELALRNKPQKPQVFTRVSPTRPRGFLHHKGGTEMLNTTAVLVVGGVRSLIYPEISTRLVQRVLKPLYADLFLYLDLEQVQVGSTCEQRSALPGGQKGAINVTAIAERLQPKLYGTFSDCRAFGNVPLIQSEAPETFYSESQDPTEIWKSAGASLRPVNCSYHKFRSEYAQLMWAEKGFALIKLHEHVRAQKYEWILKMRPDLVFSIPVKMPGFTQSQSRTVFGYPYRTNLILSWWAMLPRPVADIYFRTATAARHCDLFTYGLDHNKKAATFHCNGLSKNEVECLSSRWLASNLVRTDRVFGKHFETSLVHIVDGKRSVVTSMQMTAKGDQISKEEEEDEANE